ncbi:MAG: SelB C-terminal domain-containing protein, partial [Thermoanaerobaculia bacterium]
PRYLVPETLARIRSAARETLRRHFEADPLASGWPKQEAVAKLLPAAARPRAEHFLDFLVRLKEIELVEGEVRLPGRSIATPEALSPLARAIVERFTSAGLTPKSAAELTLDLAPKREIVEGLVRHLVARGELTRLSSGLVLATSALDELAREVRASGWDRFTVPEFKERFALSRKWAIPLLEYLDNRRVTEREGDRRRVLRSKNSPTA